MTAMTAEQPFRPDYAVPPGGTIGDLLDERSMTQTELADRLGVSLKHVNQVVNSAASVSAELALGLEKVFGVSAGFWLSRESLYRADLARLQEARDLEGFQSWARTFPLKQLKHHGFLPSEAKGTELVAALLGFLGIASPDAWRDPAAVFRKPQQFASDPPALSAWLRVGEIRAQEINCAPYDEERFREVLWEVRSLTRLLPQEWEPRLVELCASAGVAVVIFPELKGARANGAMRWLSPTKALIQLSLRYRWEDVFWYSLFHEGGHVVLHRKKLRLAEDLPEGGGFIDGPSPGTEDDPEATRLELEADRFASHTLIPPEFERELRNLRLADVPGFAERLGIAPAIVVGRLQHEGLIPYSHGNSPDLRRKFAYVER